MNCHILTLEQGKKGRSVFLRQAANTEGDSAEEASLPTEELGIDLRRNCETRF